MKRLRIALVAPPWFSVPPKGYGGVEWVVSHLAEGLVALGHDVTLYAAGGSVTAARLVSTFADPPSAMLGDPVVEAVHLIRAYADWSQFDLIHDHTMLGLIAGASLPIPVVHTIHGQIDARMLPFYEAAGPNVRLVCISHHQRSTLPPEVPADVIHNGVRVTDFEFSATPGQHLLFVGRMCPEKGILEAIEIARRTGHRLLVLAKVNERSEHEYFEQQVRPALARVDASVILNAGLDVKRKAYRDALATLFPIKWPEPFGLVMAESMAAGTPVIAFRNGSVPEVIDHGRTGFICESIDEAVAAVGRVREIDRGACRSHVEEHFGAAINIARHEQLYLDAIGRPTAPEVPAFVVAAGGQGA